MGCHRPTNGLTAVLPPADQAGVDRDGSVILGYRSPSLRWLPIVEPRDALAGYDREVLLRWALTPWQPGSHRPDEDDDGLIRREHEARAVAAATALTARAADDTAPMPPPTAITAVAVGGRG